MAIASEDPDRAADGDRREREVADPGVIIGVSSAAAEERVRIYNLRGRVARLIAG